MSTLQEKLFELKASVEASQEDLQMALAFYEVWKPVATDKRLLTRLKKLPSLGIVSVIRTALKRELLLALARVWVKMEKAGRTIKDRDILPALTKERSSKPSMQTVIRNQLATHHAAVTALFDNYASGYAKATFDRWMTVSLPATQATGLSVDMDASDINELITDLRELASRLASFALGESNDFEDIVSQHGNLSRQFWGISGLANARRMY